MRVGRGVLAGIRGCGRAGRVVHRGANEEEDGGLDNEKGWQRTKGKVVLAVLRQGGQSPLKNKLAND